MIDLAEGVVENLIDRSLAISATDYDPLLQSVLEVDTLTEPLGKLSPPSLWHLPKTPHAAFRRLLVHAVFRKVRPSGLETKVLDLGRERIAVLRSLQ